MSNSHLLRCARIIKEAIKLLKLDLSGLTVLTEAGSGLFMYTPIIAAMAGAKQVYAWTKDSTYGRGADIVDDCQEVMQALGADNRIAFAVNETPVRHLQEADIVTNSGNLRPLDEAKLAHLQRGKAVIPLMYEKWEARASDLDIDYCLKAGIKVAGTWENHPDLKIFDNCEQLMIKLALEAGYEIRGNRIIVFSGDHFGDLAVSGFEKMGAERVLHVRQTSDIYIHAADADFIFFCDYKNEAVLFGNDGLLDAGRLKQLNPALGIVHLAGDIDHEVVKATGLSVYPDKRGYAVRMTQTLAYLGPRPLLLLQAAGLKVGELLFKGIPSDLAQRF